MDAHTTLENIKEIIGAETDDDALRWVQERASHTPLVSLNTAHALLLAGGLRVGDWRAILDQVNATINNAIINSETGGAHGQRLADYRAYERLTDGG